MPAPSASANGGVEPCVIVIFGASGDLTQRKLIPSLYDLDRLGSLPKGLCILGASRTEMSDDEFREHLRPGVEEHASHWDAQAWKTFAQRIQYEPADAAQAEGMRAVGRRVHAMAEQRGILKGGGSASSRTGDGQGGAEGGGPNILFYLSVAPKLYEPIINCIGESGMVAEGKRWCALHPEQCPWQRIIVEKPFGSDLESARSLNRALGRVFEEDAIFRIDHFLGKELVQNILVMRFANTIFEPLWSRRYVDHVQVTASETVGVGSRAANYYDGGGGGALRDMVQSHLLQVLALVAIEPPSIYDAAAIMREKIKLFQSAEPIPVEHATDWAAYGRYGRGVAAADSKGEPTRAYIEEKGVDPTRKTETFAAMRLHFDNWRWAGVPFYLRSGKRMAAKVTEVVVQFRPPPINLFRTVAPHAAARPANRLIISIAPQEGISLRIEGKTPGPGIRIDSAELDLNYLERFGGEPMEAYGPLILDAIRGDRTLYKHRDEVESSWSICQPLLDSSELRDSIEEYKPGSWGPAGADRLIRAGIPDAVEREWHNG